MTPDQEAMFAAWRPYALRWAARAARRHPPGRADEFASVAAEVLATSALRFAPGTANRAGRPCSFKSYLVTRLRQRLASAARDMNALKRTPPGRQVGLDAPDAAAALGRRSDPGADQRFEELLRRVPDRRVRVILRLRFRDGLTYADLGRPFGLSRQRVEQLVAAALARLRLALPDPQFLDLPAPARTA